jgi:hypothetical protein
MSVVVRQQAEVIRDNLRRYRAACRFLLWVLILYLPVDVLLLLLTGKSLTLWLTAIIFAALGFQWYRDWRLDKSPVFFCECEGHNNAARQGALCEWVCGFCGKTHPRYGSFRFWRKTMLDECTCKARQHSLLCFRCHAPIVWDDDAFKRSPENSAWDPNYPPREKKPEPPARERRPPKMLKKHLR